MVGGQALTRLQLPDELGDVWKHLRFANLVEWELRGGCGEA
jgi:hypothetical protein